MKEARAIGNYIRVTPRKARLVADLIRGRTTGDALNVLSLCRKRAAQIVRKVLVSAIANAGAKEKQEAMVVSRAYVDEGPTLKRYMPRAMGRATPIKKRTSRITIVLSEQEVKKQEQKTVKRPARGAAASAEEKKAGDKKAGTRKMA